MAIITDFILEPSVVNVNQVFRAKLKVKDGMDRKQYITTEDGIRLITEDEKLIITEWGE